MALNGSECRRYSSRVPSRQHRQRFKDFGDDVVLVGPGIYSNAAFRILGSNFLRYYGDSRRRFLPRMSFSAAPFSIART